MASDVEHVVVVDFVGDAPLCPLWGLAAVPIAPLRCSAPVLHLTLLCPSKEVYVLIGCASAAIAHEAELLVVFPSPVSLLSVAISGVVLVAVLPSPLPLLFAVGWGVAS